jgi:hypothetical protein
MEENEHSEENGNSQIKKRSEQDKRYAGGGVEVNNEEKKFEIIKALALTKAEESRIHMEYVEHQDAIINELLRLSGLIAQLRMLDESDAESIYTEFEFFFNKYLKKLRD